MMLPVTILSGFLGAGKTTLLKRVLESAGSQKFAVLVNDFGALSIDASLISQVNEDTIELKNGCVCCSTRGDLLMAAQRIVAEERDIDRVIIEASGVSRPENIARTFESNEFTQRFSVQSILTLIDVASFPVLDFESGELALDQAAVSDLVVLNKIDLVSADELGAVRDQLLEAVPHVRTIEAQMAEVPLEVFFDLRERSAMPDLQASSSVDDLYETVAWQSSDEIDLASFERALHDLPNGVLRLKGFIREASDDEKWHLVQVVGRRGTLEPIDFKGEGALSQIVVIARKGALTNWDMQAHFDSCCARKEEII